MTVKNKCSITSAILPQTLFIINKLTCPYTIKNHSSDWQDAIRSASKPGDPSLISRTNMVQEENRHHLTSTCAVWHIPAHTYTQVQAHTYAHTFEKTHPLSEWGQEPKGKHCGSHFYVWPETNLKEREQKSSIRAWRSLGIERARAGIERGQALRLETGSTGWLELTTVRELFQNNQRSYCTWRSTPT